MVRARMSDNYAPCTPPVLTFRCCVSGQGLQSFKSSPSSHGGIFAGSGQ